MKPTAPELIRLARLRRFVGVFARGGDGEMATEALLELSRASRDSGYDGEALKRARQAAQLAADAPGAIGVRALLRLGAMLMTSDVTAAIVAAEVARERAEALPPEDGRDLLAVALLVEGIARATRAEQELARERLHDARDLLVELGHSVGAALALTQLGLLDAELGHWKAAEACLQFARDFYLLADDQEAVAEIAGLTAQLLAADEQAEAGPWFRTALADSALAGTHALTAELAIGHAELLEKAGDKPAAIELADQAARACVLIDLAIARPFLLRSRMLLARSSPVASESLRHLEAAFELGLDLHDPDALGAALEVVVVGLVHHTYGLAGWRLVERIQKRFAAASLHDLAEVARTALKQLYPLVAEELAREEAEKK